MVAALTRIPVRRPIGLAHATGIALAAMWTTTLAAAGIGTVDPALVSNKAPRPTLHPTVGVIGSILFTNTRVAALAILLVAFGLHSGRRSCWAGDLLLTLVVGGNTVLVGLELGRWQTRLLPYLPHLPLEWLGIAISVGVWIRARTAADARQLPHLLLPALLCVAVLAAAAVIEVLLTPHAPDRWAK